MRFALRGGTPLFIAPILDCAGAAAGAALAFCDVEQEPQAVGMLPARSYSGDIVAWQTVNATELIFFADEDQAIAAGFQLPDEKKKSSKRAKGAGEEIAGSKLAPGRLILWDQVWSRLKAQFGRPACCRASATLSLPKSHR